HRWHGVDDFLVSCPICESSKTHRTHVPRKLDLKPLTVVDVGLMPTVNEMRDRVEKTIRENGPILQQYHDLWYNAPHTWHYTHFLGVGLMKSPNDLWMYQT